MTHHTHHEQWHRNIIATKTNGRPSKAYVEIHALPQMLFALGVVCRLQVLLETVLKGSWMPRHLTMLWVQMVWSRIVWPIPLSRWGSRGPKFDLSEHFATVLSIACKHDCRIYPPKLETKMELLPHATFPGFKIENEHFQNEVSSRKGFVRYFFSTFAGSMRPFNSKPCGPWRRWVNINEIISIFLRWVLKFSKNMLLIIKIFW